MARSKIWKYYDKLDLQTAQCLLCEKIIKTCGNTSNLMKHMKTHPQIDVNDHESIVVRGMLKREPNSLKSRGRKLLKYQSNKVKSEAKPRADPDLDVNLIELVDSEAHAAVESVVENEETYTNWPTAETESGAETVSAIDIIEFEPKEAGGEEHMQEEHVLDEEQASSSLMLDTFAYFVCRDKHPMAVTQGEGFRRLAQVLCPAQRLPSIDQLSTRIAQKAQQQTSKLRQQLSNLQSLSLSCAINTISGTEEVTYLEVAAHYHEGVHRRSRTLLVQSLPVQYNANHVVERLERVCQRFDINKSKIMCVVSRSNSVLETAIASLLDNQRHVPCFAHQLETIFEAVMQHQEFSTLCNKVRRRVTQQQLQLDAAGCPLSSYEMLERYIEHTSPLDASSPLNSSELVLATELLTVLAPLVSAVRQLCGSSPTSYPSASVALPIAYTVLQELKQPENGDQQHQVSYEMRVFLIEQLEKCFELVENNVQLALSSLLDPRFRNMPFQSTSLVGKYMTHLYELLEEKEATGIEESPITNTTNGYDIWAAYRSLSHEKHKHIAMNGESENQDEISSYFCANISSLQAEPMLLWKDLSQFHPFLYSLAKKFLHIPASSVPPARLFTDTGAQVLAQHGKLIGEHMNNMLFLADCTQEDWQL